MIDTVGLSGPFRSVAATYRSSTPAEALLLLDTQSRVSKLCDSQFLNRRDRAMPPTPTIGERSGLGNLSEIADVPRVKHRCTVCGKGFDRG